jgi:hypothetical protein
MRTYSSFTGAVEKQSLLEGAKNHSSVYRLVLTFPHTEKDIVFGFQSVIQEGSNRMWGLSNVTVETLPGLAALSEGELPQLWKDLGDMDPLKANAAKWRLAAAGDQSVGFLAKHLDEKIDGDVKVVTKLVEELETASADNASGLLAQIVYEGTTSLRPLRAAAAKSDITPAYKRMLNAAIYRAKRHNATPTELRLSRAAQLLEIIHTKSALALKLAIPEPPARNVDAPNPTPGDRAARPVVIDVQTAP